MLYTNINITDGIENFQYIVEYIRGDQTSMTSTYLPGIKTTCSGVEVASKDILFLYPEQSIYPLRNENHWYDIVNENGIESPTSINSKIRIYFPNFSTNTYIPINQHKYALSVYTWIRGKKIVLGSYIIDRNDTLACQDGIKTFFNEKYYEYIDVPIVDPMDMIYSDSNEWIKWRYDVCGEQNMTYTCGSNSIGSVLYCSLHPVKDNDGEYIKIEEYYGGQNSINLFNDSNEFLNLHIYSNTSNSLKPNERPSIKCITRFNSYYKDDLVFYLNETYGTTDDVIWSIRYELVIGDENNIYVICQSPILFTLATTYEFTKDMITENNFDNWIGWKEGIKIKCSLEIFKNNESSLCVLSNQIPLTKDLFSYFVKSDFKDEYGYVVNNVNLDEVNMNILNINAVNKTENHIVKVEKQVSENTGVTQTVFYRVTDFPSIVIKPAVIENICINLDSYKHLVKSFILQIEGVKFIEIGRVKAGVIFKVFGSRLPKAISEGQYYILNQDSEIISGGKYVCAV